MPRYGVCGQASVDLLVAAGCTAPPREIPTVDASIILRLPETMRSRQPIFDRTGGLHAASLFDVQGNLQLVREDVGRHNSVDKLVGRALLDVRLPLNDSILLVSGCASFELVQKALMAGIPVVAALGAPSSLAPRSTVLANSRIAVAKSVQHADNQRTPQIEGSLSDVCFVATHHAL